MTSNYRYQAGVGYVKNTEHLRASIKKETKVCPVCTGENTELFSFDGFDYMGRAIRKFWCHKCEEKFNV